MSKGRAQNITVPDCARCGKTHKVWARELKKPMKIHDTAFSWWASCPSTGDPILLEVVET